MIADWQTAGWPVVRIRDIGRLHGGGTPSRKRPDFFKGDIPWITSQDIPENYVSEIKTARDYVTKDAVEESATRVVPAGAVLVTTRVTVGKTAVAGCPICFSQDITAILIHSDSVALPAYVAHFLRSRRAALLQKNQGSTITGITRDSLALEQIPLPPISEQWRIVKILQEAEEIRRLRAQAEIKTAELIPAMFYDLFVKGKERDFVPLHQLAKVASGVALGRKTKGMTSEIPYMRVANIQAGFVDLSEVKTTTATEDEVAQFKLKAGDILLTEGGDFDKLGRGCLWEGQVDPCIHQNHVFRVRPEVGKLNSYFFAHYLQSEKAKHYFLRCAKKTTNLASINLSQLKALPVPQISIEEQEIFEDQIRLAEECNPKGGDEVYDALASSLSAHAFSGKLTERWRAAHKNKLAREIATRDEEIKIQKSAPVLINFSTPGTRETPELLEVPDELTREQLRLLISIRTQWARREFDQYFTTEMLGKSLDGPLRRNPHVIEGHLAVLAARGLIIPLSREEQTADTGEYVFGTAYRLPRRDTKADDLGTEESRVSDHARLRELERLAAQLEKERALT